VKKLVVALAFVAALTAVVLAPLPVDDSTRIVTTATIEQPIAQVYEYVTTPGKWPQWHPSSVAVSGAADHSLALGERATEDFVVAGRRGRAVWTVTGREAPNRWTIEADVDGRQAGTITYSLAREGAGTRFERELTYRSPNLLFGLLNRAYIRAQVEAESAAALRRLKQVLEDGPRAERARAARPRA